MSRFIYRGGSDELQLEPGGKVYRPGDPLPADLSHQQLVALKAAGLHVETVHTDPPLPKAVLPKQTNQSE